MVEESSHRVFADRAAANLSAVYLANNKPSGLMHVTNLDHEGLHDTSIQRLQCSKNPHILQIPWIEKQSRGENSLE